MSSPGSRRQSDVMKLLMSDWNVELVEDNISEFYVDFGGPKDSPYEGGVWRLHVELPEAYPYKSPSIGFVNKIYHPNVDEASGSVCLDVINQTWSPMFDLINVFEVFLPQLLLYPNPTDPLNGEAAALLMREPSKYNSRVQEYVKRYANPAKGAPSRLAKASDDGSDKMDEDGQQQQQQQRQQGDGADAGDDDSDGGFLSSSEEEDA